MPCSKCRKIGHNRRTCPVIKQEQKEILKWNDVSSDMVNSNVDWPLNPIYWCIHLIDLKNLRLNQLFWNVKNNINPTYFRQFKKRVELFEKDNLINKNNLLLESSKKYLSVRRLYIYKIIDKYNIPYDLYQNLL